MTDLIKQTKIYIIILLLLNLLKFLFVKIIYIQE